MRNWIRSAHRFLLTESFYSLVVASVVACGVLAGRFYLSEELSYSFLLWNLILAWVPYGCSLVVGLTHQRFGAQAWLLMLPLAAAWLLFFPNALYLLTDMIHLRHREGFAWWYDVALLGAFAWAGCFLAVASLDTMRRVVQGVVGGLLSWLFVLSVSGLTGLGIYLGRFLRWNSWDILHSPRSLLADLLAPLLDPRANLQSVGVTLLFAGLLFGFYLTFALGRSPRPLPQPVTRERSWM